MNLRALVFGTLIFAVAACADSPQQISKDLAVANASQCQNQKTAVQAADCFDAIDRPLWRRKMPKTFDLYAAAADRVRTYAVQQDAGKLSQEGKVAASKAVWTEMWTQVFQWQQQQIALARERGQAAAAFFTLAAGAFLSGYNHGAGYDQSPAPIVTTSCTTLGAVTNCLSQ